MRDRNARELYQKMGLDAYVQRCNDAIERLFQPQMPVVTRRSFSRGCVGCGVGFALGCGGKHNLFTYN